MAKSPARLAADLLALQVGGESTVTTAALVSFDPEGTGLTAVNLQDAIAEARAAAVTTAETVDTHATTLTALAGSVATKARVYVQAAEPSAPNPGDLWVQP